MKSKILLALFLILVVLAPKATTNTNIIVRKIYTHYSIGRVIEAIDLNNDKYKEVISCTHVGYRNKTAIILVDFKLNKT